jgi:SecD/SecF fusion protein
VTRPPVVRALLALLVLGVTGFFAVTKEPRLGLDLRGGTQIVLETRDSPTTEADAEATDRALEVLRRRVDALGVAEPTLARSGSNRIIVELPGVQDAAEAAEAIGQTAQLTFHPVLGLGDPSEVVGLQPEDLPPQPDTDPSPGMPTTAPTTAPPNPSPAATAANGRAVPPALATQAEPTPPPTSTGTPAATPTPDPDDVAPRDIDTSQPNTVLDESGQPIVIGPAALTGDEVGDAAAGVDTQTGTSRFVTVDFQGAGSRNWEQLTAAAACSPPGDPTRRVAIVLDGQVISSPQVSPEVQCNIGIQGGSTQITGSFTPEEAQNLAVLIKGGALPVPVEIISRSTVGPSLGQEAIDTSVQAGIIGLSLTALFLVAVYRVVGVLAAVALASYGLISYGVLVALGATLTLPGLGGLLLSAGLAIDANVLVFERAREEYAASRHKRLLPSLDNGFGKAFSAIADANVTTLLAATLLFFFAAGPVRGFGVTLTIGVLASVVSALLVTRVLTEFAVQRGLLTKRPRLSGIGTLGRFREFLERRRPDLMQHRRRWLAISALALLVAFSGMFLRGFNFGVEFTGGRVVEFATAQDVSVEQARSAVEEAGFPTAVVQQSNSENITVRTGNIDDDEVERIRASLAEAAGDTRIESDDLIGPTLGSELRKKAIIALVIALAAQLAYLAIRFRWTFSAAAVLAMFHDVLIVLGVFAWLGKPIDGIFLAAALTIIGVSVNDSIVTLDRIRETWSLNRTKPLDEVVNTAIVATAPRTINTGLGAMFILAALTFLGGRSLTDFALALLVGLIVGTYSSAFTASPLLLLLEKRNGAPPPMPKRRTSSGSSRPRPARRPAPRPAGVSREGGVV